MAARPIPHRVVLTLIAAVLSTAPVHAQGLGDVITLANGDQITGEVKRLERGRLEVWTDAGGMLSLRWDLLANVVASRLVEVLTSDGRRFLGTLGPAAVREIAVIETSHVTALGMADVITITPIGAKFWRQIHGAIDAGFSYAKSSGIATLNLNLLSTYRKPAFEGRLTGSMTRTRQNDDQPDDRGAIEVSYLRYPWRRWFAGGAARFEGNESLGLELRSQVGGAVGPRVVNTHRAQVVLGGGMVFNDERGVDVESTRNVEGLLMIRTSFYTYDWPRTNVDVSADYYLSVSNVGRRRLQFDAHVSREIWKNLFLGLNVYDTFDSRPPTADADRNDVGVVLSIGWKY